MNILICSEFFHPSVGGAQKVAFELSTNLKKMGHRVHVATSRIDSKQKKYERKFDILINRFDVSGNYIKGIKGEKNGYINFLKKGKFDTILFYAAQQWTFDAVLDHLDEINSNLYLATCGFSKLNNIRYRNYYKILSNKLKILNCNIVHSNTYQDTKFLNKYRIKNKVLIPNGAGNEFIKKNKKNFLKEIGINKNDINILNVASFKFNKGQDLSIMSFFLLKSPKKLNLIMIGDRFGSIFYKAYLHLLKYFVQICCKSKKIYFIQNINREYVISSFFECDFFLFTSRLECSPLVLFETSAAGLPFFSTKVGNSEEISKWLKSGFVFSNIIFLSRFFNKILCKKNTGKFSNNGINNFKKHYNWNKITKKYLKVFKKFNNKNVY